MFDNDARSIGIPELRYIPDQIVAAGRAVELPLYQFVSVADTTQIKYSIDDFPPGFQVDSKGVVTGVAPVSDLNQYFVVAFTVKNIETHKYARAIFRLEIIGTLLLETPESEAFFTNKKLSFWDSVKKWELQLFIQQLINEHYAWIMIYDAAEHEGKLGQFENQRSAQSGWDIINFENAVMITPGNKAFEQYGNRRRLLETLREAYQTDVIPKKWQKVFIQGSDIENVGKAWVIGKELEIPVTDSAPSDAAEINFFNLNRVYGTRTPSRIKPQQPG